LEAKESEGAFELAMDYEPFQVSSFRKNVEINLGLIFVSIAAIILSMLLPHFFVGVTWNGG
jgi:hypothetical protein